MFFKTLKLMELLGNNKLVNLKSEAQVTIKFDVKNPTEEAPGAHKTSLLLPGKSFATDYIVIDDFI